MRGEADKALKSIVVPALREKGFKGSYPHFYRESGGHVDLLTFQFRSGGGSFVCEVSFAEPDRSNVYIYKDTETKKLKTDQTTIRLRLGTDPDSGRNDHWFQFEKKGILSRHSPEKAAKEVLGLLDTQAEPWWAEHQQTTRGEQVVADQRPARGESDAP